MKIGVLFWPEISAIGVFFNFEKKRAYAPPLYLNAPQEKIFKLAKKSEHLHI